MKDTKIIPYTLFLAGVLSRLPLVEKFMSHTDASSLTLALVNYNLLQETPAPPGYPVYFVFGHIIKFIVGDPHLALVLLSVVFSGIGAVIFFFFGNSIKGITVGIISSLLFLSAPSIYFFGLTVYPYIVVISLNTLFAWMAYDVVIQRKKRSTILGFVYALLISVRPQELITTLPLFLYSIYVLQSKERLKAIFVFLLASVCWVIPFLSVVGGLQNYIGISSKAASSAIPFPSLNQFITKKFELLSGLYLTIGSGLLISVFFAFRLLAAGITKKKRKIQKRLALFIILWVLPVLLFNMFIRTEHVGYQAGYLIPLILFTALGIQSIFRNREMIVAVTLAVVLINLLIFFQDRDPKFLRPYRQSSFHYSDLRRNDYELSHKVLYIKEHYDPRKTLIISGPFFWRHARYYLPSYQIYEIDALSSDSSETAKTLRKAKNFKFTVYKTSNNFFSPPKGINAIILFDNEADKWVKSEKQVKIFKGISKLTIVKVNEGVVVQYGFNYLNIHNK